MFMIDFILGLLPDLQHLGTLGYWLLLLVTFGESFIVTGMFVPGTVVLVVMGGMVPHGYYEFHELAFFAIIGAILGDAASYELGRVGRFHAEKIPLVSHYIPRGKEFFLKHQGKSVVMGRFIGPIRPIIPFIAGMMDMKRGQFYSYNVLSAFGWSLTYLTLGYVFGYAWKSALLWSSTAIAGIVGVILLVIASVSMWRWYWYRSAS